MLGNRHLTASFLSPKASEHGHVRVAQLLLEAGARVNLVNSDGATALHMACESGHPEIAGENSNFAWFDFPDFS
jgi:ankyrin repeat protein